MCGIVGAVSQRNIVPILIEGLRRLEYRGYDSCGVAIHGGTELKRARSVSRVAELDAQAASPRRLHRHRPHALGDPWRADHGQRPPHFSPAEGKSRIALVHNGIIENYEALRAELQKAGYQFQSQTDTEVIAHLVDSLYDGDLFDAVQRATRRLHGAYAIAVFCRDEPHRVVGARAGSPLVVGIGDKENFLASDAMALAGTTDRIIYLEEGDVVDLQLDRVWISRRRRQAGRARGAASASAHCGGRARPLPPLHAEGDLRAAQGDRRHARPARRGGHRAVAVR